MAEMYAGITDASARALAVMQRMFHGGSSAPPQAANAVVPGATSRMPNYQIGDPNSGPQGPAFDPNSGHFSMPQGFAYDPNSGNFSMPPNDYPESPVPSMVADPGMKTAFNQATGHSTGSTDDQAYGQPNDPMRKYRDWGSTVAGLVSNLDTQNPQGVSEILNHAQQHQLALSQQEIERNRLQMGKYQFIPQYGRDENGNYTSSTLRANGRTGEFETINPGMATGRSAQTAMRINDKTSRPLTEAEIINEAQRMYRTTHTSAINNGLTSQEAEAAAKQEFDSAIARGQAGLRKGNAAAMPGPQAQAAPPPQAQVAPGGAALKPMPPDVLAEARARIKGAQNTDGVTAGVIAKLRNLGYDPTGL